MTEKELEPHQLGWLRRPELDFGKGDVWELPDGKLYIHQPGAPKLKLLRMGKDVI
jgi:hypothetical protein